MGFDLEDEITKKVQKNKERKYDSFMNKEGQKIFVRVKTEGDE
jgi:hypothetical protein